MSFATSIILILLSGDPRQQPLGAKPAAEPAPKPAAKESAAKPVPKLIFHGETRYWAELRHNFNLGREPDIETVLVRNRLSAEWQPSRRVRFAGQLQDTRAPNYKRTRPGSAQDPVDLHEGYVEINPGIKRGLNVVAGRRRFSIADQNFIGVPEWSNSGRTYDTAQLNFRRGTDSVRLMMVSAVPFQPWRFNVPTLRDRLTGVYFERQKSFDLWFFRHDRIRRPATHSFGSRFERQFTEVWRGRVETVIQGSSFGAVAAVTRKLGPVEWTVDWELATPEFDQLYPAAHNRLGHADVISFRNVSSLQSVTRLPLPQKGRLNLMYTSNWRADQSKPVYNFGGNALPNVPGALVSQEFSAYTTHNWPHFQLGLGYTYWQNGPALAGIRPGRNLTYAYIHTAFVF